MSEAKPTPGPWNVSEDSGQPFVRPNICRMNSSNRQWRVNARLIAASPTMLAALKECREAISAGPFAAASAYQTVLDAIAKAEGHE